MAHTGDAGTPFFNVENIVEIVGDERVTQDMLALNVRQRRKYFHPQNCPLIVRQIVRCRTIPHVAHTSSFALLHNDTLENHALQVLVRRAFLHAG